MSHLPADVHRRLETTKPLTLKLSKGLDLSQERTAFTAWYGREQPHAELGRPVSFERQSWDDCFATWCVAVSAERERCAKLADSMCMGMPGHTAPHPVVLYRGNVGEAIYRPNT